MSGLGGISKNPFKAGMYIVGFMVVLELFIFIWGVQVRSHANKTLVQAQNRLGKLAKGSLSPDAETLAQLNHASVELLVSNSRLRKEMFLVNGYSSKNLPENTTAAYFDLADFVERMKALLEKSNVEFAHDERFGFTQFEQTGPVSENITEVSFQKTAMEYVLGALADAKPVRLLECRRHFVGKTDGEDGGSVLRQAVKSSAESNQFSDTFGRISESNILKSCELELSFEGYSNSLRVFMTRLLALPLPVVVKDVQINPTEASGDRIVSEGLDDGSRLVITNSPSVFTLRLTVLAEREAPQS